MQLYSIILFQLIHNNDEDEFAWLHADEVKRCVCVYGNCTCVQRFKGLLI